MGHAKERHGDLQLYPDATEEIMGISSCLCSPCPNSKVERSVASSLVMREKRAPRDHAEE